MGINGGGRKKQRTTHTLLSLSFPACSYNLNTIAFKFGCMSFARPLLHYENIILIHTKRCAIINRIRSRSNNVQQKKIMITNYNLNRIKYEQEEARERKKQIRENRFSEEDLIEKQTTLISQCLLFIFDF